MLMTDTNEVATVEPKLPHPLVALREQLNARLAEFKNALPRHMAPERFVRVVLTAVQLNPDLLTCNRQTFFNACMRAANDGLLPDGRQGVIVAFRDNNERSATKGQHVAQWMPMVAGLLTRFRNSGEFKAITANVVRDGDKFERWIDEDGEHMKHVPADEAVGEINKAYVVAQLKDGGRMLKVMSRDDIEKRRKISRAPNSLMWKEFYEEGCMKTVLRNISKLLPSSSDDLDRMLERDAEIYGEQSTPILDETTRAPGVAAALEQFGTTEPPEEKTPVETETSAAQEKKGRQTQ
jgi:recombination protein RecT